LANLLDVVMLPGAMIITDDTASLLLLLMMMLFIIYLFKHQRQRA